MDSSKLCRSGMELAGVQFHAALRSKQTRRGIAWYRNLIEAKFRLEMLHFLDFYKSFAYSNLCGLFLESLDGHRRRFDYKHGAPMELVPSAAALLSYLDSIELRRAGGGCIREAGRASKSGDNAADRLEWGTQGRGGNDLIVFTRHAAPCDDLARADEIGNAQKRIRIGGIGAGDVLLEIC